MIGVTAAASAGIYLSRGYIDPGLSMPVMLGVLAGRCWVRGFWSKFIQVAAARVQHRDCGSRKRDALQGHLWKDLIWPRKKARNLVGPITGWKF